MEKESFVRIINAIEKQKEKDRKAAKTLETIFPESIILPSYSYSFVDEIIEALKDEMKDIVWMDYYIQELDFGQKNDKLIAYDENGIEIPLSTPEELYDLIEKNNTRKDEKKNRI